MGQNISSMTEALHQRANAALLVDNQNDTFQTKYAKLTCSTLTFSLIALVGIVESAASNVFALLANLISCILPQGMKKTFTENIATPINEFAKSATKNTAESASTVVTNFLGDENRRATQISIEQTVQKIYA